MNNATQAAPARLSIEQVWLIRSLLVVSLALLASGAVTPLLTTERFYFFTNTFSLVSGLEQLVDNRQFAIAAVIGLFSLCVPVVKAALIWTAASQADRSGPLLMLADRFGKWSMLEVFVAALVIIALKLGPVVDTKLHYGAYLLATSVLLSGFASQLLAHESRATPIFSSPVTLTLGGVVGAAAATLLIGLLNPGALKLDSIVGTPESRCIQRALNLGSVYAQGGVSRPETVRNLRAISLTNCPKDFRNAFGTYIEDLEALAEIDANAGDEPGFLDRVGARLGLVATREDRVEDIENAWQALERIAVEHKAAVPAQ